jgi:hypothetical protein
MKLEIRFQFPVTIQFQPLRGILAIDAARNVANCKLDIGRISNTINKRDSILVEITEDIARTAPQFNNSNYAVIQIKCLYVNENEEALTCFEEYGFVSHTSFVTRDASTDEVLKVDLMPMPDEEAILKFWIANGCPNSITLQTIAYHNNRERIKAAQIAVDIYRDDNVDDVEEDEDDYDSYGEDDANED